MLDYELFKKIDNLFMHGQAEEARRHLMEVQSRCIALRDEMHMLKTQVQEFEDIIFLSKCLHFDRQFYWLKIAHVKQGPFCPHCYDKNGTLMRLETRRNILLCPFCGTEHLRAVADALQETGMGHSSSKPRPKDSCSLDIPPSNSQPRQARVIPFVR